MQMKSLMVFCDVVRHRSFSRAAKENEMSQSAASQLVHHLEEHLDVKLIDRSKRPFVLTPEGEVFYEGCSDLVEQYLSLEDKVRSLHQVVAGQVRVASIYSVGLYHMNLCVRNFLKEHGEANIRLEYLHPSRVYQDVEHDLADLGLVSFPKESRAIQVIPWREERITLVCSPRHRLAARDSVELEDLDGEKMVGFDEGLTIRREIDRAFQERRIEAKIVMNFDNIEIIKRAIEIEAGVGLLPEPTIRRETASGDLVAVPLSNVELVRPLGIIHRRNKTLSSTAERFIDLLQHEKDPVGDPLSLETPVQGSV
ncbi:MAG: LysR family transcriptional regulator [Planctomycetales bacterium]